jgi:hypothetical protein
MDQGKHLNLCLKNFNELSFYKVTMNGTESKAMNQYPQILPMFLIVIPGMISRVLYPDTVSVHCKKG